MLNSLQDSHPIIKLVGKTNIVFANGHIWKNQRKSMNPAFHRAMPVELFGDLSVKFFKRIDEHQGEPVSVIGLMERLTLDALARGLFGM